MSIRIITQSSRADSGIKTNMQLKKTPLSGLVLIEPDVIADQRGFFMELYRDDIFNSHGIPTHFVQGNQSRSRVGIARGLHFQWDKPLGKLIRVTQGAAFMVAVDIRKKSETVGKWWGSEVSAENKKLVYAPPGFATGFCVLGEHEVDVEYNYTTLYNPRGEGAIIWNDPVIGIVWPIQSPVVSGRDSQGITLAEWFSRPESNIF